MDGLAGLIFNHLGNIAAIVTALSVVPAVITYFRAIATKRNRVKRIERFFQQQGKRLGSNFNMSVADIVATHQMLPEEVLEAIRNSGNLLTRLDNTGPDFWSRLRVRYMTNAELKETRVND